MTDDATDRPSVLRETDDTARTMARKLIDETPHGVLAVNEPETGFPFASRVLLGTDMDGAPIILISKLATHWQGINSDNRVSILIGLPGKGDPLAHPRLTVRCLAQRIEKHDPRHQTLKHHFLQRHPKASLYIDFPDFKFFRLDPVSASLNGGFGRAYALEKTDILK